jgi:hypothetical protein
VPILPLDHPEPFAATLGVMLYPGTDKDDPAKARAFAAQWLAKPLQQFHKDGHRLPYDRLARLAEDAGRLLTDMEGRWRGALATGDVFKALYILAKDHPSMASWEHAIHIYLSCAARAKTTGSRSGLWQEIRRFRTVAHLWAAWSIRDYKALSGSPELDYDGYDDFQCFLVEAEILRDFGQVWRQPRANSEPPLPPDVWRVPPNWIRPVRKPQWPKTGVIPNIALPDDLLANLNPSGRPRKAG